jgi:hypothetical protein
LLTSHAPANGRKSDLKTNIFGSKLAKPSHFFNGTLFYYPCIAILLNSQYWVARLYSRPSCPHVVNLLRRTRCAIFLHKGKGLGLPEMKRVFDYMRVISTKAKGWQKLCWEFVQTGTAFEVPDVTPKQILFLQELCAAYRYKHRIIGNILQLFPCHLMV